MDSTRHRWIRFARRNFITIATILFCAGTVVPFCLKKNSDWVFVYLPGAERMARGDDVYQGNFVYPPINAWLVIPFVYLPSIAGRLVWVTINLTALIVVVRTAWRLSGGGRLDGEPSSPRREYVIFGIGLLCGLAYILDTLSTQQTDLVVAAIVLLGCQSLAAGRSIPAGLLLGLAAGIKCTPLLWLPYLLWRRQWTAAVLIPLVALGVNLLPELTHPSPDANTRVEVWAKRYLAPMSEEKHDIGVWAAAINFNHSINGLANRLLIWQQSLINGEEVLTPRDDRASPTTLRLVSGSILLFLLIMTILCSWRARSRLLSQSVPGTPPIDALEFSLVLLLMVLMSPHSSKPHFCTLVLPGFCLARAAYVTKDRVLWVLVLGSVVCGLVANRDLVGKPIYSWLKWYGAVTWGAVLLHLGCCWALIRGRVAPYASPKYLEAPSGANP